MITWHVTWLLAILVVKCLLLSCWKYILKKYFALKLCWQTSQSWFSCQRGSLNHVHCDLLFKTFNLLKDSLYCYVVNFHLVQYACSFYKCSTIYIVYVWYEIFPHLFCVTVLCLLSNNIFSLLNIFYFERQWLYHCLTLSLFLIDTYLLSG